MAKLSPEEKRRNRREADRAKVASRIERLTKNGATGSITYKGKSYTPNQLARQNKDTFEKALRSIQAKNRRDEARRYAKALGASDEEARKVRSFRDVRGAAAEDATIYRSKEYLSISWANAVDRIDLKPFIKEAQKMDIGTLMSMVRALYQKGKNSPSGSDDMHGFYIFRHGKDPSALVSTFESDKERGYTIGMTAHGGSFTKKLINLQDAELEHMLLSNEFTERGLATLMYVVMSNVKNSDKRDFYEDIATFTAMHLPELHKKLF